MIGLKGNIPFRDWTFDVYASKGNTSVSEDFSGLPSYQRYAFLVAQPNFGAGNQSQGRHPPRHRSGPNSQTLSGYSINCTTGLPVFQQFTPSADCLTGIADNMSNEIRLGQEIVEGERIRAVLVHLRRAMPASLWAPPIARTISAYQPGNPATQVLDSPIGLFASAATQGSTNVKEAYTEFLVPVIKKLDLELGYRFSDFNTAGNKGTWKAMFTWKALDSLSFRGGMQYAVRAPNTAELFTGPTQQVVSFPSVDPCSAATLSPWGNVPGIRYQTRIVPKVQALCRAIIGNSTSGFDTQTYNTPNGPNGFTRQSPAFFPLEIEVDTGNPKVGPEIRPDLYVRRRHLGALRHQPSDGDRGLLPHQHHGRHFAAVLDHGLQQLLQLQRHQQSDLRCHQSVLRQLIRRDPVTGDRALRWLPCIRTSGRC